MSAVRVLVDEEHLTPGSEVSGRVEWDTVTQLPDRLVIRLLWHTEGKGTEDSDVVDEVTVPSPGISSSRDFRFSLPTYPWSFSGSLISVVWKVEATLEGTGLFAGSPFVMAPDGKEIVLRPVEDA